MTEIPDLAALADYLVHEGRPQAAVLDEQRRLFLVTGGVLGVNVTGPAFVSMGSGPFVLLEEPAPADVPQCIVKFDAGSTPTWIEGRTFGPFIDRAAAGEFVSSVLENGSAGYTNVWPAGAKERLIREGLS